jgi:hypothetical protein
VARDRSTPIQLSGSGNGALTFAIDQEDDDATTTVDPVTGEATFTPDPKKKGSMSFTFTVTDDNGTSPPATVTVDVVSDRHCEGYLQLGVPPIDGVYTLEEWSGGNDYTTWCDMTSEGGGWTLVLKSDPADDAYRYDGALWTNTTTRDADNDALDRTAAKLRSFTEVPFNEIRVGLADVADPQAPHIFANIPLSASSLLALLQDPARSPTFVGRTAWRGLVDNDPLQDNCNLEGANVAPSENYVRVRLGIIGNGQDDCGSPDSFVGVGAGAPGIGVLTTYSGSALTWPEPGVAAPAWGAVLVRSRSDHTALPVEESCSAHRAAARTSPGFYRIDPGADGVIEAYCEMSIRGGGWTLVGASVSGGSGPFGWGAAAGDVRDLSNPYSMGPRGLQLGPSQALGGTRGLSSLWHVTALPDLQNSSLSDSKTGGANVAPLLSECADNGDAWEFWGYTAATNHFRMDNEGGSSPEGLHAGGFNIGTAVSACLETEIEGRQGLLFVR